jgi:hypothetical protein
VVDADDGEAAPESVAAVLGDDAGDCEAAALAVDEAVSERELVADDEGEIDDVWDEETVALVLGEREAAVEADVVAEAAAEAVALAVGGEFISDLTSAAVSVRL